MAKTKAEEKCPECNGIGKVLDTWYGPPAIHGYLKTCETCGGKKTVGGKKEC